MSVVVDGREWKEFSIEWKDVDGKRYSFNIFAISAEHASYVLEEIKNTAVLAGEIVGRYEHRG